MPIKEAKYIWHQGTLVPWQEATVHVLTHALHYGSSVFEGIRAYHTPRGSVIFRLTDHLKRLYQSARIHRIPVPHGMEELEEACRQVMTENQLSNAYIRPLVYSGYGGIGAVPDRDTTRVSVAAFEWGSYLGEEARESGVDVAVSSWQRPAPNTLPTMAKAGGNYLSTTLMTDEAKRLGYDEAIALDYHGFLSEGPGENLFLVKDGVIYTPAPHHALLMGVTRDSAITIAGHLGFEVREASLPREFLYVADELFFTGTAAEVMPIRSVDGLTVGNGRRGVITEAVQSYFFNLFTGKAEDHWGWLEPVLTET